MNITANKQNNNIYRHNQENQKQQDEKPMELCTKYNQCIDINIKYQNGHVSNQDPFQIPSIILQEEKPMEISIQCIAEHQHHGHLADLIVANNIRQIKNKQLSEKLAKNREKQQKEERLDKLKQQTSKRLQNCRKKPLSQQKRMQWNHSIYGQKQEMKQEQKSLQKDEKREKREKKERRSISLKKVEERIEQYKKSQKQRQKNEMEHKKCKHEHISKKDLQQSKAEISKRAQDIMKEMKQNKLATLKKKKMIKAKIEAIQRQSRKSLNKFKKKPVDPTVQFIVDIGNNSKQVKGKQKNQVQKADGNQVAQKQDSKRLSKNPSIYTNQRSKKSIGNNTKIKQKTITDSQKSKQSQPESSQQDEQIASSKFYFWDMPIYNEDMQKIGLESNRENNRFEGNRIEKKSFGEEVREYLIEKNRQKMHRQNKESKRRKMQELVLEKKQMFLEQFQDMHGDVNPAQEYYWSEDQLFKQQPISNFNF